MNSTFRGKVLLADGSTPDAILKDLETKELCNELLVAALGHTLGLPIPKVCLAVDESGDIPNPKGPLTTDGFRLVLASLDMETPSLRFRLLNVPSAEQINLVKEFAEWEQLGELYAFDTWVANIDRHTGNLLLGAGGRIWMIDHGHCFGGPKWKATELVPTADFRNRLSEWLTQRLSSDQRNQHADRAAEFATKLLPISVSQIVGSSGIADLLDNSEVSAVTSFLDQRIGEVPSKAASALGVLV